MRVPFIPTSSLITTIGRARSNGREWGSKPPWRSSMSTSASSVRASMPTRPSSRAARAVGATPTTW
jgi:hypothetical protein